jgi:branched-chain amino acid transport system permease protein
VALGFVLIFKASGVFNLRRAPWCCSRRWPWRASPSGFRSGRASTSPIVANLAAFVIAGAIMFVVAWLIERLVLRHLVNQEGATLLMATLGITYFLEGLGQTLFGSDIYKIDVGMPKDPIFRWSRVPGRPDQPGRRDRRRIAAALVALLRVLPEDHRPRAARRGRRPPGRAVHRHSAVRIWVIVWCVAGVVALVAGMIWGSKLGVQFSLTPWPCGAAGGDSGRPDLGARRHHRRPDHRRGREALRGLPRPLVGGGIEIWFAYVLALVFLLFGPGLF